MNTENKSTFFTIDIKIPSDQIHSESYMQKLEDGIDLVLYSMQASNRDVYKIYKKDGSRVIILFKAVTRKRKGQLNKFCSRYLDNDANYRGLAISRDKLIEYLAQARLNADNYKIVEDLDKQSYDGRDIRMFDDRKNWYSWQKEVYNMIYNEDGTIKEPDPRAIISLVDFQGGSGKSSFFKYLYTNDESKDIGRAGYGTAQQLRSALINQGPKRIYIIDLSRAKSKYDTQEDLLSILEDCKSGFIISPMYGQSKELIMEPPHIIVSSNYLFDTELLSKDRWNVYELKQNKLGIKNQLIVENKKKKALERTKESVKKR